MATIPVGNDPNGIAVTPDGSKVYVTNYNASGTVRVINTTTDSVVATIPVVFTLMVYLLHPTEVRYMLRIRLIVT